MKLINYFAVWYFAVVGLICLLVALIKGSWSMACVAALCLLLASVAYADYRKSVRDEN